MGFCRPEARTNGSHVLVQAAFGAADIEGERPLKETAEDLHLICTAVLGDLEPLNQELYNSNMTKHFQEFDKIQIS